VSKNLDRSCATYWDFVHSVYLHFGRGPFTVAECRKQGINPPRGMAWFRNRSVVHLVGRRRSSDNSAVWALSGESIAYIEERLVQVRVSVNVMQNSSGNGGSKNGV